MPNTKFIRIKTADEVPGLGTYIVINYKGELLMSRYGRNSTDESFRADYEYFLREVMDVEQEMEQVLKSTHETLEKSIKDLEEAKQKIEFYQQEIKR